MKQPQRERAISLLRQELASGSRRASEVIALCTAQHISPATLKLASKFLNIGVRNGTITKRRDGWWWSLPTAKVN